MPPPQNPVFRELALKELTHHAGPAAGAATLAAAAFRAYEELSRTVGQLIGQAGMSALTGRALHLAQQEYPWLVHRREPEQPEGPFEQVVACLKRQEPAVAADAAAVIFATLAGLLVTFIGEHLTMQLLRKAWPDAFSSPSAKEAKA